MNAIIICRRCCAVAVSMAGLWLSANAEAEPAKAIPDAREPVVFIAAHPDDIISSIGTMLLMKDRFQLHVVDYTDGGINPRLVPVRRKEEAQVCAALDAKIHYIDERDGDAFASREAVAKLERILRDVRPRAVFAHWPIDVHADHVMSFAALMKAARKVDCPFEMYFFQYTINSKNFPASIFVDITSVAEEKWRIIRMYASQNPSDAMCQEEMITSRRVSANMWPPNPRGYAEAFALVAGRPQGPSIFTEIRRAPNPAPFPNWGK